MDWSLQEAITYYREAGAPRDQSALISLLREIQRENGGSIPGFLLDEIADAYRIKVSLLHAIIKRIPSLRLRNFHCLEMCSGPNCGKHAELAAFAEKLHANSGNAFVLKYVPCMRMCGKGPNIKWDGTLYHRTDPALLQKLLTEAEIKFK